MLETLINVLLFYKIYSLKAIFIEAYVFNLMDFLSFTLITPTVMQTGQSSDNKVISKEDKSYLTTPKLRTELKIINITYDY